MKRLAREHRVRLRRRGDGAFTAEIRKGLAVATIVTGPPGAVMVHRDRDGPDAVRQLLCRGPLDPLDAALDSRSFLDQVRRRRLPRLLRG